MKLFKQRNENFDVNNDYFFMSFHFNKTSADKFGMTKTKDNNIYKFMKDGSLWEITELYDLGWGNEYGFARLPRLNFNQLWQLVLDSKKDGNKYGAASYIEKYFIKELKEFVVKILATKNVNEKTIKAFKILNLDRPFNRYEILGKTVEEIQNDYEEWNEIANKIKKIE